MPVSIPPTATAPPQVPRSIAIACRLGMSLTDIAVVGHLLGTQALAGASLAQVWLTCTSTFLFLALGMATNTLCSQAVGARNTRLANTWLAIAMLTATAAALLVGLAWAWGGAALLGMGFRRAEAVLAERFTRYAILGVWPAVAYPVLTSYLQARGVVLPMMAINACMLGVNAGLNFLLIGGAGAWPGLGFIGSPIATAISRWLLVLALAAYVWVAGMLSPRGGSGEAGGACTWSDVAHAGRWREFLVAQTLPAAVGRAAEEWQLQAIALLAARLGEVQLSAHTACLNLFFFVTSLLYGPIRSAVTRIGHYLGSGEVAGAQMVAKLNLVVCSTLGACVAVVFFAARSVLGRLFSSDPRVVEGVAELAWFVGGGYTAIALFYASMAVLSGAAKPRTVAVAFLIGAWAVCVPLAYVLANVAALGLAGLWAGLVVGYAVVTAISCTAVMRLDWEGVAREAVARSAQGDGGEGGEGGGAALDAPLLESGGKGGKLRDEGVAVDM